MPVAIDMNLCLLKFSFFMLKHHAYSCILLAIEKTKDDLSQPLRPREELEKAIRGSSLTVIEKDPLKSVYSRGKDALIYKNEPVSWVYKVTRKSDKKLFVMKITQ